MFGFAHRWIFKSRWAALAFAAFVCWTVAEMAAPNTGGNSTAPVIDDAAMAHIESAGHSLQNLTRTDD